MISNAKPPPSYNPDNYGMNQEPGWQTGHPPMQTQQPRPIQARESKKNLMKFNVHSMVHSWQDLGRVQVMTTCPNCRATITTTTTAQTGTLQYIAAGGLFLMGCWLGCCCIPMCIDSWQDVTHTCPNCNIVLGKYHHGF